MKALKQLTGDHEYDLSGPWSGKKTVTQSAFFEADGFVVGIGELNRPNCWDYEKFDAACQHLKNAWNALVKEQANAG